MNVSNPKQQLSDTQMHHSQDVFARNKRHVLLVSLLPIVIAINACHKQEAPKKEIPRVLVTVVGASTGQDVRTFSGIVMPRYQTAISFRASGKVIERLVEVGQQVKQGQVLARLDPADYTLAAKAADAQLQAAQVDATQAASDAARFARLLADGSVGAADAERQKARADAANATQNQAAQNLALANNKLSYLNLTAPSSGIITSLNFEAGQMVGEGMPVAMLSRQGEMDVVFDVPEDMVDNLSTWQAKGNLSGQTTQKFSLVLRELSPAASMLSKTFQAKYRISAGDPSIIQQLKQGMNVELSLSHAQTSSNTILPATAVLQTSGQPFVWIVTPANTLKKQAVHVDKYANQEVWVSGLLDGMRVVSAGAQKLDGSTTVEPMVRTNDGALHSTAYGESVNVAQPIAMHNIEPSATTVPLTPQPVVHTSTPIAKVASK